MKKRIAISVISVLAVLVAVLAFLYINTLQRFSKGTASPDGTMSIDSVSSASVCLQPSDYTLDNATDAFSLPNVAVVISTVNADGTPNAASMQPTIIDKSTISVMSSLGNQTLINISERQYAIFTVYSVHSDGSMGTGARLVVTPMSEEEKQNKEIETGRTFNNNMLLLKVVKVLSLG